MKTLEEQIADLTAQVATLTTQNGELTSQYQTSQGELRSVRHRATFKEVALANGVKPRAVDSLYRLSGYEPGESDEADPETVKQTIAAARDDFEFCFEPVATEVESPPPPTTKPAPEAKPRPAAVATGKGKTPPAPDRFRVSRSDTSNPAWLLANKEAYARAGQSGTLEVIED
jgi:hypothetical protein